jgi:toxin ParE1/3/4
MRFKVNLVIDAETDLFDIYLYVAQHDSPEKAGRLLNNLEKTILRLETTPLRGSSPPELESIGVYEFREIYFKPYRIIYQVIKTIVYVHCIIDGRRDLQDLLQKRLLR